MQSIMGNPVKYAFHIGGAVIAETTRRGFKVGDISSVIGVSRPTAYKRISGEVAFNVTELEQIASWLNIDVQVIFDSAELGARAEAAA